MIVSPPISRRPCESLRNASASSVLETPSVVMFVCTGAPPLNVGSRSASVAAVARPTWTAVSAVARSATARPSLIAGRRIARWMELRIWFSPRR